MPAGTRQARQNRSAPQRKIIKRTERRLTMSLIKWSGALAAGQLLGSRLLLRRCMNRNGSPASLEASGAVRVSRSQNSIQNAPPSQVECTRSKCLTKRCSCRRSWAGGKGGGSGQRQAAEPKCRLPQAATLAVSCGDPSVQGEEDSGLVQGSALEPNGARARMSGRRASHQHQAPPGIAGRLGGCAVVPGLPSIAGTGSKGVGVQWGGRVGGKR
jgi:hypothetical protein